MKELYNIWHKICYFFSTLIRLLAKLPLSEKTGNLYFLDQVLFILVFSVEIRRGEHHYWALHIPSSLGTKFDFEWFQILGPNLPKKGISGQKQIKWTSPKNSPIRISEDIEFHDKLMIMIFWTKFVQVKRKIAPLRATAVATYYIKLIREGAERQ